MNSFSSLNFDDVTIYCETEKWKSTEIIRARPFPIESVDLWISFRDFRARIFSDFYIDFRTDEFVSINVTYDLFNNEFHLDRFEFDISLDLVFIYKHLTNCTKETVFNKWLLTFKSAKRQNNRVVLIVRYRTRQHNGI